MKKWSADQFGFYEIHIKQYIREIARQFHRTRTEETTLKSFPATSPKGRSPQKLFSRKTPLFPQWKSFPLEQQHQFSRQ